MLKMSSKDLCVFDRSGESLAVGGLDGEVRIWDVSSGTLKQRFTASASAGGDINSLVWSKHVKEKRKRRSSTPSHAYLAVAIGNDIIVWNVTKGEKERSLSSSHTNTVTSLSWGQTTLYSGSSDQTIVDWEVTSGESKHQWKADRQAVTCVCCHDNGEMLLSAGRSIKLWNLSDYSQLKKWTGHSTSVRKMVFVNEDMFLSLADSDRIINIWSCSVKSRTAVGALTCDEEVGSCDLRTNDKKQIVELAATSVDGALHLFKFPLTNQIAEPISAFSSVQYASETTKESTPTPLPILTAHLSTTLTLAHTSTLRPHFETLDFNQSERRVCLLRDVAPGRLLLSKQKSAGSKVVEDKVTILGPGNMTIQGTHPLKSTNQIADSVPMSERLNLTTKSKPRGGPSAESLTQLLSQAVASGDGKLLEEVLRVNKEKVVTATIRRLPVSVVLPFLRKLIELLQSRPARGLELSLWIRTTLTTHTAYLMTVPQLVDSLSGLYQLLDARVTTFSRLSRLQGKLDLMLMQAAGSNDDKQDHASLNTPMLTVTLGDDSVQAEEVELETSDEDWSSGSESSLSEDSDQSEQSSNEVAMETEHSPSTEFIR